MLISFRNSFLWHSYDTRLVVKHGLKYGRWGAPEKFIGEISWNSQCKSKLDKLGVFLRRRWTGILSSYIKPSWHLRLLTNSALSGAVSRSAVAPLERIKVIFQVSKGKLIWWGLHCSSFLLLNQSWFRASGFIFWLLTIIHIPLYSS